jgi:hypothetical protein
VWNPFQKQVPRYFSISICNLIADPYNRNHAVIPEEVNARKKRREYWRSQNGDWKSRINSNVFGLKRLKVTHSYLPIVIHVSPRSLQNPSKYCTKTTRAKNVKDKNKE